MKFGDKLIALRKKNGMSQETLAEKLGVSRQSVSKWESNNTYPETDKIIQIANLFDCSMDDLINDKITDVEQSLRSNKNKLNNIWDSLLEFITKTINMFSHMKFSTGLKCVIEMIISAFLLMILGHIICGISSTLISNLFVFISHEVANTINNVLNGVFHLIWFILEIIILIHIFKIRYLNYYEESKEIDNKVEKKDLPKGEKIIIRDEKNEPFAFLGVLSTIIIIFIKIMAGFIAFSILSTIVFLTISSVLSITLLTANTFFIGTTLSLISSVIILVLFLILIIKFIFSKKINVKLFIIILVLGTVLFGVGIGISTISLKNIEIVNNNEDTVLKELDVDYKNNIVIKSYNLNKYTYQIDNNLEDNKIIVKSNINDQIKKLSTHNTTEDKLDIVYITSKFKVSNKDYYKLFIKDIKNNKIHSSLFNDELNDLIIVGNENTINNLLSNLEKLYLIEKENKDNNILVTTHESKVHFPNGFRGEYDATTESLIYYDNIEDNYICEKTIQNTKYGDKIVYNCNYKED